MDSIKRKLLPLVIGVSAGVLCACGPAALQESIEVTTVRYERSDTPFCAGEVKSISQLAINNLQVLVEFQNADGNRVRTGTESVSPNTLAPGTSGSFSIHYLKGSNDPRVVSCRVVEFMSSDGGPLLHTDKSGAKPRP